MRSNPLAREAENGGADPIILRIEPQTVLPDRESVLREQGVPPGAQLRPVAEEILTAALAEGLRLARPVGMYQEIDQSGFEWVHQGEGMNHPDDVVARIFPKGARLALFAGSLGPAISDTIQHSFAQGEYPFAYNLDTVASLMADAVAELLQRDYQARLACEGWGVMRYSPGYCGWHLTGQQRLFRVLSPSRIGMTLTESCLMQPMKSVSGVLIAGPRRIHVFSNNFGYCNECKTLACRDRIREMLLEGSPDD